MIRVLLAVAHSATRRGFALLLNRKLGITDICEATNGCELETQLKVCKPGLLILDWSLPGRPPLETCQALKAAGCSMQWVILSISDEASANALALGATFIHKSAPAQQVLAQLRELLDGKAQVGLT